MDLEEVKVCLRGLLSSTAVSCNLNRLLCDFRNMTGSDLPLFGHLHPIEFLKTLDDTVKLFGNPYNPDIALVQSLKSAHITSLVDRQKTNATRNRYPQAMPKPKRLIVPDRNVVQNYFHYGLEPYQWKNVKETKTSHAPPRPLVCPSNESVSNITSPFPADYFSPRSVRDTNRPASPVKRNCNMQGQKFSESNTTKIQCFEDISDSESCLSIEDCRSSSTASSSCFVNEGIKNKLRKLIRCYPKGLWCCELPEAFQKEYDFALDYREYGYTSLIQMLSELPDVFRCIRPGNEDWLLFDASVAPSPEEKKMMDMQATADINCEATANVRKLLFNYFENSSNSRMELDSVLELYKKMFGRCLDFQSLGFKDLKSFLKVWEGSLFSFLDFDEKTFLVPLLKVTVPSTIHWQEALPPITAENDIFVEIFPKEVVGPEESLLELDLARQIAVGSVVKVSVAEVWSPSLFYLQLNKFRDRLDLFMDDLQRFYNVHLNKYKMPDSTIRPKQICVGLYTSDPDIPDEWHRAQIVKVINEKIVLVNFVDFGTETRVKKTHLRFLHRSFQSFPVQGLLAQLSGIAPANGESKWPITTSKRFLELVRVPTLDAEIVDIDFKKPRMNVILFDPSQKSGISINRKLIQLKLACSREPDFCFLVNKPVNNCKESETKSEDARMSGKKASSDKATGAWVQESFSKGLPEIAYEFSDIADLGQTSPFKMRSLKNEQPSPIRNRNEGNAIENLKYEFEDVPDLDVKFKEEEKQGTVSDNIRTEAKHTKSVSVSAERLWSSSEKSAVSVVHSKTLRSPSGEPAVSSLEKSPSPGSRRYIVSTAPAAPHSAILPSPAAAVVPAVENLRISSPEPVPERELKAPLEVLLSPSSQSTVPVAVEHPKNPGPESPAGTAAAAVATLPENLRSPSPRPHPELGTVFSQSSVRAGSNPSLFPRKPKRLPPGLEHPNPVASFEQIEFLQPPDDLKKKINILAMEFLTTNSSIKQVGLNDPVLAVKIATEMAEACLSARYSKDLPCGFTPPTSSAGESGVASLPSEEVPTATTAPADPSGKAEECVSPQCQPQAHPKKRENEFVREQEIAGKTLHMVTIDRERYFCVEEIVRNFTIISGREVADRILQIKKIHIDYRILTKGTDEKVLNAIKSSQLQIVKKKSKKLKIFLLPLAKVLPFLQGLGCGTKAFENDILKLQSVEAKTDTPE